MQTISGIHYNFSLPGAQSNDAYFALIRNFRRHSWLLLYLFGASPAVCSSFVAGRPHELQRLGEGTRYLPYATSLRMGRLGYQSDAQSSLKVSYNSLESYAASLQDALTRPYRALRGHRRPDRRRLSPARHQHAADRERVLRHDPPQARDPAGRAPAARVARARRRVRRGAPHGPRSVLPDRHHAPARCTFSTCICSTACCATARRIRRTNSTPSCTTSSGSPSAAASRDSSSPTARGRCRSANGAREVLAECAPIAAALDAANGSSAHRDALASAIAALNDPAADAVGARARRDGARLRAIPTSASSLRSRRRIARRFSTCHSPPTSRARFAQLAEESLAKQRAIEAADTLPFDTFLRALSVPGQPQRLTPPSRMKRFETIVLGLGAMGSATA